MSMKRRDPFERGWSKSDTTADAVRQTNDVEALLTAVRGSKLFAAERGAGATVKVLVKTAADLTLATPALFEIALPDNYPTVPPLVTCITSLVGIAECHGIKGSKVCIPLLDHSSYFWSKSCKFSEHTRNLEAHIA
jgi:hypothetical protein